MAGRALSARALRAAAPALIAAAAAHVVWIGIRVAGARSPAALPLALAPLPILAVGLWRRSPMALLVFLPLAWALPAYLPVPGDEQRLFEVGPGLAAVSTLVAYCVAALMYLRRADAPPAERAGPTWRALDEAPVPTGLGRARARLAAWTIAAPAILFLAAGGGASALRSAFGRLAGMAAAGLCALGLLLGLAVATDLLRGRGPRPGRPARAGLALVVLCGVALAALGAGLM